MDIEALWLYYYCSEITITSGNIAWITPVLDMGEEHIYSDWSDGGIYNGL